MLAMLGCSSSRFRLPTSSHPRVRFFFETSNLLWLVDPPAATSVLIGTNRSRDARPLSFSIASIAPVESQRMVRKPERARAGQGCRSCCRSCCRHCSCPTAAVFSLSGALCAAENTHDPTTCKAGVSQKYCFLMVYAGGSLRMITLARGGSLRVYDPSRLPSYLSGRQTTRNTVPGPRG